MLRTLVGLVAVATVSVASAAAKPAAQTRGVTGFSDTAETVMGTLTAPPSRHFLTRIRNGKMGGVLLLGNGWLTRHTAATVTAELQQAACTRGEPLLIAVDQEGGLVRRLAWAPPTEAPAYMSSPSVARSQASGAAAALSSVGIDIDLAPVVDTPASSRNFLRSRAFSHDRRWNAKLGRAFVSGLQKSGVAAATKHFPGLGLAGGNTDHGKIVIGARRWKLQEGLLPFRSAIQGDVKLMMVSSAIYPNLDRSRLPAVYSKKIVQSLLRQELGFHGVVVTDSLSAPAAYVVPHPATSAIAAGDDLLLFGSEGSSEWNYSTLVSDAAKYPNLRLRLAQSAARVRALKAWLTLHGGPVCSGA
jgi:beta-N-acetylhexosaminidase